MSLNQPQPPPLQPADDNPEVWPAVLASVEPNTWLLALMRERDAMGRAKYGVPLRVWDGRDAVADALQEALDLVVYLQRAAMRCADADDARALMLMRSDVLDVVYGLGIVADRVPKERAP